MKKVSLSCAVVLLLTAGATWAQGGGPGQAAALCEGLQDATPGLYGLCLAFHNVEPCVPDLLAPDPFAGCKPKDGRLLAQYDALKEPDDPRLPGTKDDCPCFTEDQIFSFPVPYDQCAIDEQSGHQSFVMGPYELYYSGIMSARPDPLDPEAWNYWLAQADVVLTDEGDPPKGKGVTGRCHYVETTVSEDVLIIFDVTYEQTVACRAIVLDAIGDGSQCPQD